MIITNYFCFFLINNKKLNWLVSLCGICHYHLCIPFCKSKNQHVCYSGLLIETLLSRFNHTVGGQWHKHPSPKSPFTDWMWGWVLWSGRKAKGGEDGWWRGQQLCFLRIKPPVYSMLSVFFLSTITVLHLYLPEHLSLFHVRNSYLVSFKSGHCWDKSRQGPAGKIRKKKSKE